MDGEGQSRVTWSHQSGHRASIKVRTSKTYITDFFYYKLWSCEDTPVKLKKKPKHCLAFLVFSSRLVSHAFVPPSKNITLSCFINETRYPKLNTEYRSACSCSSKNPTAGISLTIKNLKRCHWTPNQITMRINNSHRWLTNTRRTNVFFKGMHRLLFTFLSELEKKVLGRLCHRNI